MASAKILLPASKIQAGIPEAIAGPLPNPIPHKVLIKLPDLYIE